MPIFYDQLNRRINLSAVPKRIISVVPSQTELLFYLGLDAEITGITSFCIHPREKTVQVAKIGGTKQLDIQKIHNLKPELIIANKEENLQGQIEELMALYPVWISDVYDLPTAVDMIGKVGSMTGKRANADKLIYHIQQQFTALIPAAAKQRIAYLIWRKPYMVAGTGTFINAMLQMCGCDNVFDTERYPVVTFEELMAARPDVLFLSSEPYPFAGKHIAEFKEVLPNAKIILVNGEMFSWYGSRLLQAPVYFNSIISQL